MLLFISLTVCTSSK